MGPEPGSASRRPGLCPRGGDAAGTGWARRQHVPVVPWPRTEVKVARPGGWNEWPGRPRAPTTRARRPAWPWLLLSTLRAFGTLGTEVNESPSLLPGGRLGGATGRGARGSRALVLSTAGQARGMASPTSPGWDHCCLPRVTFLPAAALVSLCFSAPSTPSGSILASNFGGSEGPPQHLVFRFVGCHSVLGFTGGKLRPEPPRWIRVSPGSRAALC